MQFKDKIFIWLHITDEAPTVCSHYEPAGALQFNKDI